MPESVKSEHLFRFLDDLLDIVDFPDYPGAINGLQVEGQGEITRIAAAVDASEETIQLAVEADADLLLVHHGLFWGGTSPIVGPVRRKLGALLRSEMALYAAHLPLDAHPEVGNAAVMARELGISVAGGFGEFDGRSVGCWGSIKAPLPEVSDAVAAVVGGPARLIQPSRGDTSAPDPSTVRVGIATGAGHGFLAEAVQLGLDVVVTGEAPHHAYHDFREAGVSLILAGHYATETFGVRALAEKVEASYGIPWTFIDVPTGL